MLIVVIVLAAGGALYLFKTKKKQLSHAAVESYIGQQYSTSNVSCNGGKNFTLKNGASFTCTASGNQRFTVTIKNKSDGSYQVVKSG